MSETMPSGVNLKNSVIPLGAVVSFVVLLAGAYNFGTDYVDAAILTKAEYFQTVANEHARRIGKLEEQDKVFEEKVGLLLQDVAVIKSTLSDIRDILSNR